MNDQGVAVSMVFPILKTIVRKGYDTASFCKETAFDERLLEDAENRITVEELERLMKAAARYTEDDYFGLHQGQMTEIADLGILGYVMMHSGTIADALAAYQRYNVILCSGFILAWDVRGEDVRIRLSLQGPGRMSRHCAEDMASSLVQIIGKLSNRRIPLKEVFFEHEAPPDNLPYLRVFESAPHFGGEQHLLVMSKEVLSYPVLYSDARLLGVFENMAQETRDMMARNPMFSEQIVLWMKKCLPSFMPTLQQTADHFGVSTRTIQHKLKDEDTTYQHLSIRVRKELATDFLRKEDYSVGEIAYALHYSEPSAFQNAFKKWTGLTPGQYREQLREEGSRV
ncbi:AraC family transcriptional regulator [Paenibacillus sp. DMB20]|uniref:AraC family transcriptional regulator n=1 Tax=Paenibacillus sp. DMB20 TaxID=1642570 RepID=UPI00062783CA|nr:AraC family transcriptional regulator [Paenibacillus sp. DMB20]KKO52866.1 transcriptional regulator [Paenibacillus sp. DMB20]KKO53768.1 transcriptional regulator [Paenibacillus sp. DMB20]